MMEKLSDEQMNKIKQFDENYKIIMDNINKACVLSKRNPKEITLLAATKTVEPYLINHAIDMGIICIGENRVQELLSKYDKLNLKGVSKHFIGHLQTNKVKQIIDKVDMIESVDSIKLLTEISNRAKSVGKTMDVLIEVNIGYEENKSGIAPEHILDFMQEASNIDNIKIKGLMAIPPVTISKDKKIENFSKVYDLLLDISKKNIHNISTQFVSMGMSNDYVEAICCGANIVRIGSSLFGKRV